MDEHDVRRCIERKREGGELSAEQWSALVAGFMDGSLDESQIAALCMACVWRGMSFDETVALTRALVRSGDVVTFGEKAGRVVDKHSTGGVGDIVSLAAVPLAAACGARVAKLSGRALGHTGGTIDKLETIPGFTSALPLDRFVDQVERVGCAIAAQTASIVPADKKLYALRDRTATVPALGLIAASIVSKKIAGGAHALVFDVKTGAASFVRELSSAQRLAQLLVDVAQAFGKPSTAFVTDMSQPLGRSIGSGLELIEARDLLQGRGDERARELVVAIAHQLVRDAGKDASAETVAAALENGSAYAKFVEMIAAHGGDVRAFEAMSASPTAAIPSPGTGFVQEIDAVRLGHAARGLSGRDRFGGLRIAVRIGDRVEQGEPLLQVFGRGGVPVPSLQNAVTVGDLRTQPPPLIHHVLRNGL